MVKALLAVVKLLYSSAFLELLGAAGLAYAAFLLWALPGLLIVASVALLLKSFELDFGKR